MPTEPATPAKKKSPESKRFMLSFPEKYAETHTQILEDAEADDRDPGEYVVRWLDEHYAKVQAAAGK
jgi:hypothetical protein